MSEKNFQYVKKPVMVEAFQWTPDADFPIWFVQAIANRDSYIDVTDDGTPFVLIKTLEGKMTAYEDDYIIRGIKGELYPCKPDIFIKTYNKCDEAYKGKNDNQK